MKKWKHFYSQLRNYYGFSELLTVGIMNTKSDDCVVGVQFV